MRSVCYRVALFEFPAEKVIMSTIVFISIWTKLDCQKLRTQLSVPLTISATDLGEPPFHFPRV